MGIKRIWFLLLVVLLLSSCQKQTIKDIYVERVLARYDQSYYLNNEGVLYCPEFNPDSGAFATYSNYKERIVMSNVKDFGIVYNGGYCIDKTNDLYVWNKSELPWLNYTDKKQQQLVLHDVLSAEFGDDFLAVLKTDNKLCLIGKNHADNTYFSVNEPLVVAQDVVSFSVSNRTIVWIDKQGDMFGTGINTNKMLSELSNEYFNYNVELSNIKNAKSVKINEKNISVLCDDNLYFWGNLQSDRGVDIQEIVLSASVNEPLMIADNIEMFDSSNGVIGAIDTAGNSVLWGEFYEKNSINTEVPSWKVFEKKKLLSESFYISVSDYTISIVDINGKTKAYGSHSYFGGLGNSIEKPVDIGIGDTPCIWK